jgi:hypothetical protein
MIPATDIEYARRTAIEDEINHRGIKLKPRGAERVGPCDMIASASISASRSSTAEALSVEM